MQPAIIICYKCSSNAAPAIYNYDHLLYWYKYQDTFISYYVYIIKLSLNPNASRTAS